MNLTSIEWTTFSANPLKYRDADGNVVWACIHCSTGCLYCYAEQIAKRYGKGGPFNVATTSGVTPFLDDAELHKMLTAKRINGQPVSGSRCFVGDMTDVFGEWVPFELLDKLFAVFALRPDVTLQILTKRPERMREYMDSFSFDWERLVDHACDLSGSPCAANLIEDATFPLPNVWLGTSVENQPTADARIPHLLQTPAAVRFVSAEPLLGPIRFADVPGFNLCGQRGQDLLRNFWCVTGGESGHKARPAHPDWFRSLRDQCHIADVPYFFKQWGEWTDLAHAGGNSWTFSREFNGKRYGVVEDNCGDGSWRIGEFETDYPWVSEQDLGPCMVRVGKKAAGRLLDGREWNEFPAVRP